MVLIIQVVHVSLNFKVFQVWGCIFLISFSNYLLLINRNTAAFKLTLYPAVLLNWSILLAFLIHSLSFFMHRIIASSNKNNSISFFPICMHFILFRFLYVLYFRTRSSSKMLTRSSENGYPCLIPGFRGNIFGLLP